MRAEPGTGARPEFQAYLDASQECYSEPEPVSECESDEQHIINCYRRNMGHRCERCSAIAKRARCGG
jgi:hypothetical protein